MRLSTFFKKAGFLKESNPHNRVIYFNRKYRVEIFVKRKINMFGSQYMATTIKVFRNANWQSWVPIGSVTGREGDTKLLWIAARAVADPSMVPALAGIDYLAPLMTELLK